ncbi:MAG TPA: stage II sporulation protein E [Syntrophomonas sp.]|nr:stage II sporulation protein E [Syntrophomonas sp.]HRW13297.1 stage II sporulation protein E [Syntrophomonas sp.]
MLERLEIYPYQRMEEEAGSRKMRRKIGIVWGQPLQLRKMIPAGKVKFTAERLGQLLSWENLLLAGGALILSRAFILGELLPFIFAFVAVFAVQNLQRSLIGLLFSLLGLATVLPASATVINMVALGVMVWILNTEKIQSGKSWWGIPVITAAVVLVIKSAALMISGLNFYQEMVIVFEALISGIISYVLLHCLEVIQQKKPMASFSFEEMGAFMVLGMGLIMGLGDLQLFGLEVSSILCRLAIMIAAYLWGTGGGTIMGVMAGILPSIASSLFAQTLGMYSISGLLAGIFRSFGRLGVIVGYMLGTLALSMFMADSQLIVLGLWETGIASIVFMLLPESLKEKLPTQSLGRLSGLTTANSQTDWHLNETIGNRIHHLAQVFDELSSTLTGTEEDPVRLPGNSCLNYLYDELSNGFCEGCHRFTHCWNHDYQRTAQEILELFCQAESAGQLNYEDMPLSLKKRCLHGRELVTTVNYLFDNLRINEYWSEKMGESRQLVARQLKGVGQLVRNLADEIEVDSSIDVELREQLLKACKRLGINLKDVSPVRCKGELLSINVISASCVDGSGCDLSIAPALSSALGQKWEVCQKNCPAIMGRGACDFTLKRAFNYQVVSAVAQVAREEKSGDSLIVKTLDEGKELVVLSDGMGVGAKACEESNTAVKLLLDLLAGGFDKELALKTINSVLLLRSRGESFTTMDMMLIDLFNAELDFIKIASAPAYIKRGKQITVLSSSSLPIGILEEVEVNSERKTLLPRDIILMVSDGVMEASREQNGDIWIPRLLAQIRETDPHIIAQMVINRALSLAAGKPGDDMTAICLRLDIA